MVPACGKENIDRPVTVFRGLGIPTYFIFDGDLRRRESSDSGRVKVRNARYQRLAGVQPAEFPETQCHRDWAVYSNDRETELRQAIGADVFDAIVRRAADELHYDKLNQLLKNTEGAARVIDLIYDAGHRVQVLETIVDRITELRFSCDNVTGADREINKRPASTPGTPVLVTSA